MRLPGSMLDSTMAFQLPTPYTCACPCTESHIHSHSIREARPHLKEQHEQLPLLVAPARRGSEVPSAQKSFGHQQVGTRKLLVSLRQGSLQGATIACSGPSLGIWSTAALCRIVHTHGKVLRVPTTRPLSSITQDRCACKCPAGQGLKHHYTTTLLPVFFPCS